MNKKTIGLVAGGLGLAFAGAAGLWSMYPENREKVAVLYEQAAIRVGLAEPTAAAPEPIRNYIETGFPLPQPAPGQQRPAGSPYMADMAAQGCSANTQVMRLAYGVAFVSDERRDAVLGLPQIGGDHEKYMALRREQVARLIEAKWKTDITGALANLNLQDRAQVNVLEAWLNTRTREIYRQFGLQVAFRVNTASGVQSLPPRSDAVDACTPQDRVTAPLENAAPATRNGPSPF